MSELSEKQQELVVEIGLRLRNARETHGLTLQELATRTRIHAAYLDKIEQGNLEGLPPLPFVRGFIRNYVQCMELDDPSLLEAVSSLGQDSQRSASQPLKPTTEKLLGMETEKRNYSKWLLLGLLVVLLIWVTYLVVRVSSSSDTPAPATSSAAPAPAPAPPPVPAASPTPAAPEPKAPLRLTVRGLEETWVRLALDRKPATEMLVRPAETLNFDANDEIRVTVGKSNGISLYLNGEEVGLPSEKNRLVPELVLNKLNLLKMQN